MSLLIVMIDDDPFDVSRPRLAFQLDAALAGLDAVQRQSQKVSRRVEHEEDDDGPNDRRRFGSLKKEGDEKIRSGDGPNCDKDQGGGVKRWSDVKSERERQTQEVWHSARVFKGKKFHQRL